MVLFFALFFPLAPPKTFLPTH